MKSVIQETKLDQWTIGNLVDWIEGFMLDRRAQQVSKGTIQFYEKKFKKFLSWCAMQKIATVDEVDAHALRKFIVYLEEEGHNRGGVIAYIKALRAFFNWYALETDSPSPMKRIKTPKPILDPLEPAKAEDIIAMIKVCDMRDKAILLFLLDTGVRARELIQINVADVNFITGTIRILHGKGGKSRIVFIGRKTRKALRAYVKHTGSLFQTADGGRFTYSGLRQVMRRKAEKAGVPVPALHSFRRLFAITMLRNGVDIYTLQLLMGHADLQVLKRYLKLTQTDSLLAHQKGSPVEKLL